MTINCTIICTNLYHKFQNLYQSIFHGKINFPLGCQGNVTPAPPLLQNGLLTIFFLLLIIVLHRPSANLINKMKKNGDLCEEITGSFMNWVSIIAIKATFDCLSKVDKSKASLTMLNIHRK